MIKDAVYFSPDFGDLFYDFYFDQNPNLQYLCVSPNHLAQAQSRLTQWGYINCALNSYCNFNPGVPFYSIQGTHYLDLDNNGCDEFDNPYPNLMFTLSNSAFTSIIPISGQNYSLQLLAGSHTITPVIDNPAYFNVSPASVTISFPSTPNPAIQNFCISPNGEHNDIELTLIPLNNAIPGFDATYKIIGRNVGTTYQDVNITFSFDDAVSDVVSVAPTGNQTPGSISWMFPQVPPFGVVQMNFTLNLNSPTETPALNSGDVLTFSSVAEAGIDETPANNLLVLNQTVLNAFDPNDKVCLEGAVVTPELIDEYVHYVIRFENTGNSPAQNIVVKDIIDTSKFDVSTLVPISASHAFEMRISSTNNVEFIFEDIMLPFDDASNDGYIAFKIKTLPTLAVGDTFSNAASIYFDYNFPIVTNTATTTIQQLGMNDFDFSDYFTLYPNPAANVLNLKGSGAIEIKSISVYNTAGQLLTVGTGTPADGQIDVSTLKTGTYFIKINSSKGSTVSKFIKE
jgi:hypothetical protein